MKRIAALALALVILCFAFVGCKPEMNGPTPSDSTSSEPISSNDKTVDIVYGTPVKDEKMVKGLKEVTVYKKDIKYESEMTEESRKVQVYQEEAAKDEFAEYLTGGYTKILGVFERKLNDNPSVDSADMPIMILQQYSKEDIEKVKSGKAKINVKGNNPLSIKDAEKYAVYSDDKIVIYDMFELINGMTFEMHIKSLEDEAKKAEYPEFPNLDYVRKQREDCIKALKG